ncbi:hypothetical protein FQA39_LY08948 [Lamprigera yunnana]|nr:hypothetical protein FQA39_LY08948 [Lamprigera yunnana]
MLTLFIILKDPALVTIDYSENEKEDDSIHIVEVKPDEEKIKVPASEYKEQEEKVEVLNLAITKMKKFMRSVDMEKLPDKGCAIFSKIENLTKQQKDEDCKLKKMVAIEVSELQREPLSWKQLETGLNTVAPQSFGKQALKTLTFQKVVTMESLEQLHGSLKTCPTPEVVAEEPKGLKVELMSHQKHALAWLIWRERQKPSGGILADDMGLGKTLTMISLILKSMEIEMNDETNENADPTDIDIRYVGGTLVVCPASLIYQWEAEIKKHLKRGLLSVGVYHGNSKERNAKRLITIIIFLIIVFNFRLSKYNVVLSTYGIVRTDSNKDGLLFSIKWRRIILDEAHQVRNHKSLSAVAVCELMGCSRWALTGTPVHNKELDLYSLLKFLRCSPFDDLVVWKRWIVNKCTGGQDRLNTVISSLMLRRTKEQLAEQKVLTCLPEKEWKLIEVSLEKNETDIYQKVLIFSRTLFAQFLHQRAEKDTAIMPESSNHLPNHEYFKMHQHLLKLNRVQQVNQIDILVLLLRLRQICCHPSLITKMLHEQDDLFDEGIEVQEELNILEQLNKLNIYDKNDGKDVPVGLNAANPTFAEASKHLLNPSNPVFAEDRVSSKMKVALKIIQDSIENNDKIIMVSQWKKVLDLFTICLKKNNIHYLQLDGTIDVHKRMEVIEKINNPHDKVKVLLLSLTAGGVGLNLVGANRLILFDLHWNPQLEIQAQDRIYRVGQSKPVQIFKLMVVDTIEQRIKQLQEKKMDMATGLLTGVKQKGQSSLSLQDLKMLFAM